MYPDAHKVKKFIGKIALARCIPIHVGKTEIIMYKRANFNDTSSIHYVHRPFIYLF